jgi:hypothetical protein
MVRNAMLLAGVLALVAAGYGQTGGKKKSDAGEIEVSFANGSVVRMALLQEKVEIDTAYGKLTVPASDIRRIDFGLHLPEGADKKIESAIKQLASAEYKERESGVRELVALGAYAYPALLQAAKSGEPETAKRAQDALGKIKAKVPAKDLRLGPEDKVVTPRFTIVGRITSASIKAKSEYFGEVELSLTNLRNMRALTDSRETQVAVDAAKYAQPNQWLDTGVTIGNTATLSIIASGEVELLPTQPGKYICGPKGFSGPAAFGGKGGKKGGVARALPGTLLGRIGENGDTFVIGDRYEGAPEREGKLYLQIMSSPYEAASTGSYQVRVSARD